MYIYKNKYFINLSYIYLQSCLTIPNNLQHIVGEVPISIKGLKHVVQ